MGPRLPSLVNTKTEVVGRTVRVTASQTLEVTQPNPRRVAYLVSPTISGQIAVYFRSGDDRIFIAAQTPTSDALILSAALLGSAVEQGMTVTEVSANPQDFIGIVEFVRVE